MRYLPLSRSELLADLFYDPEAKAVSNYRFGTSRGANLKQNWCRAELAWEAGRAGEEVARLDRLIPSSGLDVRGNDTVRFFGATSKQARIALTVNGHSSETTGSDDPEYVEIEIRGDRILELSIAYTPTADGPGGATLIWLALVDSSADGGRLDNQGSCDPAWTGLIRDDIDGAGMVPQIGLLLAGEDLPALRRKLQLPAFEPWIDSLRGKARDMVSVEPESLIGDFAASPLLYTRPPERDALYAHGGVRTLAFLGLLDQDPQLMRAAARWMLSYAHCRYWYNDAAGELPGSTWHHRSFTEAHISHDLALALDWAGGVLTESGRHLILDAIARRGLPRMEQDFMHPRAEYIRKMNQGLVFNCGRIFGLLALSTWWPRARARVEQAARDEYEMLENTFTLDGATVEGPGYWQYTLLWALTGTVALARSVGKDPARLLPQRMRHAPEYPPVVASTAHPGRALSIADSHGPILASPELAALLHHVYPTPAARDLLGYVLHAEVESQDPSLFLLFAPADLPRQSRIVPEFAHLRHAGMAVLCREAPGLDRVRLQIVGAPGVGGSHSHHDRGNVLLEARGEDVFVDRGVGSYSSSIQHLLRPAAHNLLVPDTPDGSVPMQNLGHTRDISPRARYRSGTFAAAIDTTSAWPDHVVRCTRKVRSAEPHIFELTDELVLSSQLGATLHFQTPCSITREDGVWTLEGEEIVVRIRPRWEVVEAEQGREDMGAGDADWAFEHLQLRAAPSSQHCLVTEITIAKK